MRTRATQLRAALRTLDPKETARRNLKVYLYQVISPEKYGVTTQKRMLEWLAELGLPTQGSERLCASLDDIYTYLDEWETGRFEHPIDTDGVVVKLNDISLRPLLRVTAKAPKWAIASSSRRKRSLLRYRKSKSRWAAPAC